MYLEALKTKSKRDMSANPGVQRNKYASELLRLEKNGVLKNLPKICVDTVFLAKPIKFLPSFLEYDRTWLSSTAFSPAITNNDCRQEYMKKDQLKQNNKFIKSCKVVYDMSEKSPYYTDSAKPYIDDKKLVPLKDNGQFVPHRRFKAAGFRRGLINTGIPLKDKYYLELNPYYVLEDENDNTLIFESRFEWGNLRKAIVTTENEYDLWIRNDYNAQGFTQWFYFKVNNTKVNTTYTFNLVNHFKPDSLHNQGMRPLMYSTKKAKAEGCGWFRVGKNICYYPTGTKKKSGGGWYYCLSFSFEFEYEDDEVYFAHWYPYTYRDGRDFVNKTCSSKKGDRVRKTEHCKSLGNNILDLIIITNFESPEEEIAQREAVVVSARVHPGETVSSFIVEGVISFLVSDEPIAKQLRDSYVFKIVPMLNPDGVVLGNYRTSLSGQDLNRQWGAATARLFPEIFYTKQMLNKTQASRNIFMFVDIHGHSRKKNIFMYGCHNKNTDKRNTEKLFPLVYSKTHHSFSFDDCNFNIQKDKETTGRVVIRREYNVINSLTLEASFWGPNIGRYQDCHFTPNQLREAGKNFCVAISHMHNPKIKVNLLKELQSSIIPSNEEIDKILTEFEEEINAEGNENDKIIQEVDSPVIIKKRPFGPEEPLSCKGKKFRPEFRSHSNLKSLSLSQTAGKLSH
jgi:hypothetical protein